ncbi:MAG TPA: MBL fold metallo-hydrolase [Microvirga sp.]|jgi:glyoxylase-like metal-dependent hydrolase (beta-lactamase superfamily II)|nr:MBL fold metallo-hydrolase [Microvirga sp.]
MTLSRRTVLAAAPLAAAASMGGPALAQTQTPAPAASRQAPGFYRFKVGDLEVTAVNDGFAPRPLEGFISNADIAQVKAAAREAFLPEDTIQNTFTALVVKNGDRLTVIDTGLGEFGAPTTGQWMTNFRAAGFDPAQVNTIIVSHFHGDHIGGIRRRDGSTVFPNAEIMVPAAEWAFWMDEARMNQAPEAMRSGFQNARRVFGPMAKDVKQYEPGKELVTGITSVAATGHTPGHTAFVIASGDRRLMMLSDAANHPALFVRNPDWSAVFDMDADQARQTRRRLLDMAAAERTQVSFYHAPFPATGFIAKEGNGYRFQPVQWSSGI